MPSQLLGGEHIGPGLVYDAKADHSLDSGTFTALKLNSIFRYQYDCQSHFCIKNQFRMAECPHPLLSMFVGSPVNDNILSLEH